MSKILNILFIPYDKFPPFRVDVSDLFGKYIANRGHCIHWILQSEEPIDRTIKTQWTGGKALVGPYYSNTSVFSKIRSNIASILIDFKMFNILKKNKYDIILLKDKFVSSLLAIPAAKIFNVKLVYWLSFPYPEECFFIVKERVVSYPLMYFLKGFILRILLYRIILPSCDHAFVQSENMKKNILKLGISQRKITAFPMAVSIADIPYYGYSNNERDKENPPIIVYLGSLEKIRKIDFILRMFKLVLLTSKYAKLYLVGGSKRSFDEKYLIHQAKVLGIGDQVLITGQLPQKEAWKYVKNANVCVSPIPPSPIFDVGSPTKLLEYMAMGKASVVNDQPEQKKVIKESGAGICVPYNETSFSIAIVYLLKHKNIAQEMGTNGRDYIIKYRDYSKNSISLERKLFRIVE